MRLSWRDDWPVLAVLAAAAMMIAPLWCVDSPAMPDYPAHLASFFLIAGGAHDPLLARSYFIQWAAIPNLGFEVVVPLLSPLMDIAVTTKLLLSAAVAMWVIAPSFIYRELYRKVGVAPVAAVLFAYNDNFIWGFFNYYLSAGLALVFFAVWLSSGKWARWLRAAIFAVVLLAIYFCHVFGAALLLLLIGCYELQEFVRRRDFSLRSTLLWIWPLAAMAAPSLILFIFFKPSGTDSHIGFHLMSTFRDRFEATVALTYDHPGYSAFWLLMLFLVLGFWRGWIGLHRSMTFLLLVLLVLTFIAPEEAMGGWGVELRLPAVLCALIFASLEIRLPLPWQRAFAAVIVVAVAFKAMTLAGNWRYYDAQFHEFRAALTYIPRGQRIVTVLDGDAIGKAADQPYWHLAEFAVMDRAAFTPLLFTTRGQHVVQLRPGLQKIAAASATQGSPPDVTELDDLAAGQVDGDWDIKHVFPYLMYFQCNYDEVVLIHLNPNHTPVSDLLSVRHVGSFFTIYNVDRDNCPKR
jgi:hypothetical protein